MASAQKIPAIPFHILAKPAGADCNLACEYCFYLDKGRLYPGSRLRMTDEVLTAYIKQVLTTQPIPEVSVAWQGGEPTLMGLEFFERSIELVNQFKRPGQRVSYTLQTNGTQLDKDWCHFFKKNDFLIGLSCDGPEELHNAFRVDKGGRGTFKQVKRSWDLLQRHQVDTNILCAVQATNSTHALEVYRFFRDNLRARFIQFIPIVERDNSNLENNADWNQEGNCISDRSVNPIQYGEFLIDIFDEWVKHDVGTMFIQMFDSSLASWYGIPESICVFQETCGRSLVLEHNGDLYACDHFVDQGHLLGNILNKPMNELVDSSAQRWFGMDKREQLPKTCLECDVRFACHGECPRNRFPSVAGDEGRVNYLCKGYRMFFRYVDKPMRKMADLLRKGRSAAEIMG